MTDMDSKLATTKWIATPDASDPGNRQSAETEWQTLKAAVTGAAAKTLSKKTRTVKKEWIKPDTFALIEEKRNCERHGERYKDLKRQVRSRLRRDRTDHLMNICQDANEHLEMNTWKGTGRKTCSRQ